MTADSPEPHEALLQCPACRSRLAATRPVPSFEENCPVCGVEVSVTTFPRLFAFPEPPAMGLPVGEDEASCSFFPDYRAERVCDECGCFLSARAAARWGARELCLPCLHRLREEEKTPDYLARAKLSDRRALALVTLFAPFTLFTAPLALYLLLRYRNEPRGFVPRGRGVWWLSLALALLWLVAWSVFLIVWISLIVEDFT